MTAAAHNRRSPRRRLSPGSSPSRAPTAQSLSLRPNDGQVSSHSASVAPRRRPWHGHHASRPQRPQHSTTETAAAPQNATPNVVVVPADSGITLQDLTGQVPGPGLRLRASSSHQRQSRRKSAYRSSDYGRVSAGREIQSRQRRLVGIPPGRLRLRRRVATCRWTMVIEWCSAGCASAPAAPAPQPAPQIIILQQPASGAQRVIRLRRRPR